MLYFKTKSKYAEYRKYHSSWSGSAPEEADITNFAGLTGDWHPLHPDVEYAAKIPFKERIAHGMIAKTYLGQM